MTAIETQVSKVTSANVTRSAHQAELHHLATQGQQGQGERQQVQQQQQQEQSQQQQATIAAVGVVARNQGRKLDHLVGNMSLFEYINLLKQIYLIQQ